MLRKIIVTILIISLLLLSGCMLSETKRKVGVVNSIKEWNVGFTYSDTEYQLFFVDGSQLFIRGDISKVTVNQ